MERPPIADERTNSDGLPLAYGLALHSLSPQGRGMIVDLLQREAYLRGMSSEALAVLHHELDRMVTGPTATPENHIDGVVRITRPLGVVRREGWTAGLCGLRATNHEFRPQPDPP